MLTASNPRELYPFEYVESLLAARQVKDHYKIKVPDGIYDHADFLVRYVIIDGQKLFIYSKMWLDSGCPDDTPREVSEPPFGYYPDYRSMLPPKTK